MDRIRAMRQRDWALVFGLLCTGGAVVLSLAGADWEGFILLLGALMLLRGALERPVADRAEGVLRALVLILLIFAFAAVNRAQGGEEGAAAAVFGNWILWAVAALLIALPILRRGLVWGVTGRRLLAGAGLSIVLVVLVLWPGEDGLRLLVVAAVLAQAALILPQPVRGRRAGLGWGTAMGVAATALAVAPGGPIWLAAVVAVPLGVAVGNWHGGRNEAAGRD